jgi:hypothetical protein
MIICRSVQNYLSYSALSGTDDEAVARLQRPQSRYMKVIHAGKSLRSRQPGIAYFQTDISRIDRAWAMSRFRRLQSTARFSPR